MVPSNPEIVQIPAQDGAFVSVGFNWLAEQRNERLDDENIAFVEILDDEGNILVAGLDIDAIIAIIAQFGVILREYDN